MHLKDILAFATYFFLVLTVLSGLLRVRLRYHLLFAVITILLATVRAVFGFFK
jgi:hypothetical protein